MLAYAAGGGRQGIVQNYGFEGLFEPVFFVKLKEARNIHLQRTVALTGRQLMADLLVDACEFVYESHCNFPCQAG